MNKQDESSQQLDISSTPTSGPTPSTPSTSSSSSATPTSLAETPPSSSPSTPTDSTWPSPRTLQETPERWVLTIQTTAHGRALRTLEERLRGILRLSFPNFVLVHLRPNNRDIVIRDLRAVLTEAREELDRHGHGDMHYTPAGWRDEKVLKMLERIDAILKATD